MDLVARSPISNAPTPAAGNGRHHDWLSIVDCGARGDGTTSSTAAIQAAIDRCGAAGGGTVMIPPGKFVTGTLWMRSHVTLHLEPGATLLGDLSIEAYPAWVSQWERGCPAVHAPLLAGENLENIAFTGRGLIDGRGQHWWEKFHKNQLNMRRASLLRLVDCRDVLIQDLTFTNSPFWTVNPTACDNVTITGITIRNPADSPNTDGINPDSCSNVHIANCHIDVGDDCITLKSGAEDDGRTNRRACQNITITNCTMLHGHGGVVIGSEMSGGVRNVAISNCVFCSTDRGIRLKSRRGRGAAVEDLRVDNIVMDEVLCPIVVNMFYGIGASNQECVADRAPHPVNTGTPQFRRLRFSNITARNVKYAAIFVLGLPEMYVEDIAFDGISVYLDPANTQGGSPAMALGVSDMCRAGAVVKNARNIKLRRIDIRDQSGPAVCISNSVDVVLTDLYAKRDGNAPLVVMDDAEAVCAGDEAKVDGQSKDGDGHAIPSLQLHSSNWRSKRRRSFVDEKSPLAAERD